MAGVRAQRRRGVTLIEAVAAVVIMAIAIPPMLWAIRSAHIRRAQLVQAATARWLAEEKIEDLIADRYSTTRGFDYLIAGNYSAETPVTGFPAFSRTVGFRETQADLLTPGIGYLNVTVTVSWTDAVGVARNLPLRTVITEFGS